MNQSATEEIAQVRAECQAFRDSFTRLRTHLARTIVGQQEVVEEVLIALFADGHALLEGVPGLGKTLLVRSLAQSLGLSFSRIQCTPDIMPADITGTTVVVEDAAHGQRRLDFRRGPIFAQLVLADEVNRATPKSQSALLEAMQERSVTVGGTTHQLERPFLLMATQNPIEQEGTYPLPEAQADRFLLKIKVRDVKRDELNTIVGRTTGPRSADPPAIMPAEEIIAAQRLARRILIAPHVQDYAVRLVLATQPGSGFAPAAFESLLSAGASPRGAQAIVSGAKVRALLDGRVAVSTTDIRALAAPALRHRVMRTFEAEARGVTVDDILKGILTAVPAEAQE